MRKADPVPRSKDPKFYAQLVKDKPKIPDVERICEIWEKGISDGVECS